MSYRNIEEERAYRRAYREAHSAERCREWRTKPGNKDKTRNYQREWIRKWRLNPENKEKERAANNLYRRNNREHIGDRERQFRIAYPKRYLISVAKVRAKKKGLEFSITEADFEMVDTCPVLGIPLVFNSGQKGDNSPSLDRIDNSKGYIPGNVLVVSWRANKLKSDASLEELAAIAKFYGAL